MYKKIDHSQINVGFTSERQIEILMWKELKFNSSRKEILI